MSVRHVAHVAGKAASVLAAALIAVVLAVVLCLDTTPARRLVAEQVNRALAHSVKGQIRIEDLRALRLLGRSEADVSVRDPAGRPVLTARGARVRVAMWASARSVTRGMFDRNRPLEITLSEASVDRVDALLDTDAQGRLELLNAFAPTAPPSPSAPPGRGIRLVIPRLALKHARARGQMGGARAPALDVEIDGVAGALDYAPAVLVADLSDAAIAAHGIARGNDVRGALRGHVRLPSTPGAKPAGSISWQGSVAGLAHSAHGELENDTVSAVVNAPEIRPETVRVLWPDSPVDRPGTLNLEVRGKLPRIEIDLHAGLGDARLEARGTVLDALGPEPSATISVEAHDLDPREFAKAAPVTRLGIRGTLSGSLGGARGSVVSGHVEVDGPDLEVSPGQGAAAGHARLLAMAADGALDLGTMTVAARLGATAADLEMAQGTARIGSASLSARALGGVAAPYLEGTLHADHLIAAGLELTSIAICANGSATRPHVVVSARGTDLPAIDATLDVDLAETASLNARVEGLGAPAIVALESANERVRVRASSGGLDLARVGRLARLGAIMKAGTLAFDADVSVEHGRPAGRATADLTDGTIADVPGLSAHLELESSGGKIAGKARVRGGDFATIDLSASRLEMPGGGVPSIASWRRASGDADLKATVDLEKLAARVPPERWPVQLARGKVTVDGHLARAGSSDRTPELGLSVTTEHLAVAPRTAETMDPSGVVVMAAPPWRLEEIDFNAEARIDRHTGGFDLSIQVHDTKGELAEARVTSASVPYAAIFDSPEHLQADLRSTPFDLHVAIPERGLGSLPEILRQNAVLGRLRADVNVVGTLAAPAVDVTATLRDSLFGGQARSSPMDVDLSARYEKAHGTASLKAHSSDRTLLDAEAQVDALDARALLAGRDPSRVPWIASARAHLAGFPLEAIGPLDDKRISGRASGDASISNLHEDARADCNIAVDSLRVGGVGYRSAKIQVKADRGAVDGSVRIDQADGFAEARMNAAASWGSALAPSMQPSAPLAVSLASRHFRLAGLLPFVGGALDELDGRVDSDARIEVDPVARKTRLSGSLALSRGVFETAAGGGEFHDVTATVKLSPDGSVTVEKLSAQGITGRLEGAATAQLDGLGLRALKGVVVIPNNAAIPVSVSGIEVGNVDGRLEVSATSSEDGRALDLTVDVPRLRVVLPEGKSTSVQSLGPMDKVQIGAHRGNPATFVLLAAPRKKSEHGPAASAATAAVAVHLGDVEVIRGKDLKVDLGGQLKVGGSHAAATGQIRLKEGGFLSIQGRKFTVESGTVTFVGPDPSNPEIVVKAGWKAPDGTVVYATFTGPLRTGKVTLSAEPKLSQQEIVELLLFGSTQGQQATATASTQNSALSTVGGEAAQPINHALNQIGLGAVSANIDTTTSANPRPEVAVQIARDISLQVAVVLGQVPPGVNPDHTLLTIDWRFLSRWSLASTVGDAGTTIFDLLWQRRY